MRALFVNENIGGHATVHATLRAVLAAQHPEVDARFVDVPPPTGLRRIVGAGIPGLGRLDLDLQPLRAQLALSQWVRRRVAPLLPETDVVHVYTGNAALRFADHLAHVPSVVSTDATNVTNATRLPYRDPSRFTPAMSRISQRFERPVYDAATFVVANSHWVSRSLRADYGVAVDRMRVLPFGVLAPDFEDDAAPGTTAPGLPQVVFVGRQLERKGALWLLDVHQRHLADEVELVLVTSESVPPARNVRVVDDVTVGSARLWEVLRGAALFAFPSTIDQAPNAVLEAMAAGLPLVVMDLAAMAEMVTPDCGYALQPGDEESWVSALRGLAADPGRRADLGAASRRRFLEVYDARASTRRLVGLLGEAQQRHAAADDRRGHRRG